jgi:ABC-2 type transport system permease protein
MSRAVPATRAVLRSAFADAAARRSAFWTQIGAMIANDLAWVAFWVIFFQEVASVRGWDVDRVLLLLAVLCTSAGLVLGLFSNSRRIPTLVADGSLDEVLTLPVAPLPNLLVRRLDTVNLGDVAFGLALFAVAAHPTPQRTLVYVAGTLASAVLLTGFLVLTGSLVFFTGRGEGADLGLNAVLLLASYPADVFAGATKVLLYTVVPAAFVSGMPAELVDDFDLADAALLLGVAGLFAGLGWSAFTAGLRRYSSGSAWARG